VALNPLPMPSAGRQPRGLVKVNGTTLPGWIEWEFDNNSNYQADTFLVTYAGGALPAAFNVDWLTSQGDLQVEILAGFPKNPAAPTDSELKSFIIGRVDDVVYDPVQNTVRLSGRDFTSQFIDAKTTEVFKNQTVAQIVQALATRHGMSANVAQGITPLGALAGSFYEIDHARLTTEHSEWDLLTWLAQQTQCSVFVTGQTLNFQPAADPTKDDSYVLQWNPATTSQGSPQFNGIDLKFSRNLTLTKDVKVTVTSWNAKQKARFSVTAHATKTKNAVTRNAGLPFGQPQQYSYTIPGLTHQEALDKAQALLSEISKHEMRMDATLAADNILTAQTLVTVQGTGTKFDQVYFPDSVIRSMSIDEGYRMRLSAKNHSPQTTVTL
jgi:phage protein D